MLGVSEGREWGAAGGEGVAIKVWGEGVFVMIKQFCILIFVKFIWNKMAENTPCAVISVLFHGPVVTEEVTIGTASQTG